jgi:acyl-coenzyme A synthetase/AMP-(fatty) acid ligase
MASQFIETLEGFAKKNPSTPIMFDDANTKGLTYEKIEELTGKVYGYLKAKGVGKEDFVLINLPRGVMPVLSMVGVWKAGAAWALVEDTYAPERIEYIRKDCGCKYEINASVWEEIMNTDYLAGHEDVDDHDAAYAIYTSGTTGNPKGVLHEYGNLMRAIDSVRVNGETPVDDRDRLALLAPLNFVASVIVILKIFSIEGCRMYIVSYATIKNPMALKMFFFEKRISLTFLTPSYVRMLGNQTGPFLRLLVVGSEPANNLYNPNLELINVYAQSESGFAVGIFKIDKAYETCPIGKPEVETKITLIGEDGNEVPDGEMGELCFENPYVRGYMNLPEETAKAFVNGIYHTGDLAKKNPNGDYVLLGRSGDMIKINGNRIEPAEIEAAFKQATGASWAAAKGFTEGAKAYLCAYYTDDLQFDAAELRKQLQKRLPYYMIPAYFMKIDSVPLKPNGKLDRKALPEPDAKDFKSDYVAPKNETEEKLCKAFAKVLGLESVGTHDDFYEMGGDSLASIQVISENVLPGLNASDIFRGRTAEKIALLYAERAGKGDGESDDVKNERSMKQEHPLTTEQLYMVDYQLYTPKSTMCNLFTMLKFDKETYEAEKLAAAVDKAIMNHPALLTTFSFNQDGEVCQKYTPELHKEIHAEKTTEWELDTLKDTLVQPFKIIGGELYRCRVFETEKASYVFFDVHHTVFDGTSFKVLMGDVIKAYMGMDLDQDYYYLMLQQREDAIGTDFYNESKEYFEKNYDGDDWQKHPKVDDETTRSNDVAKAFMNVETNPELIAAAEKNFRISRNEFFITIAMLSIAMYNSANKVQVSWIYNGREDLNLMASCGLLFRELPVGLEFKDDMNIVDMFDSVHNQVRKGIEHSIYPYVETDSAQGTLESAMATLLYQQDIRDAGALGGGIGAVDVRQNAGASENILDMQVLDGSEGLQLAFDYTASRYKKESMEKFQQLFAKVTQIVAENATQQGITFKEIRDELAGKRKKPEAGGKKSFLARLFGSR